MRQFSHALIAILISILLSACSINMRKGDNMMEAGDYDQAVTYYEKALAEDPGDEEAASKLLQAQYSLVSADLIRVRQLRQGNQLLDAAHLLNKTLSHLKHWDVRGDSGVKTTIEEEVRETGRWLNAELLGLGKANNYNTWGYYSKAFANILTSGFADEALNQYSQPMKVLGSQQCEQMKTWMSDQSYYFYTILQGYCGHWGQTISYTLAKDKTRFTFAKMRGKHLKINKAIRMSVADFNRGIAGKIESHPWFSADAVEGLLIHTAGQLRYGYNKKKHTFSHTVIKDKETIDVIPDPKDPKKVIKKVVHKEPVRHDIEFDGLEHSENYAHHVTAFVDLLGKEIEIADQQALKTTKSYSHTKYIEDTSVRPLNAQLLDKDKWQNNVQMALAERLKKELDIAWIYHFCGSGSKVTSLQTSERVARCAEMDLNHISVQAWSQKHFGLPAEHLWLLVAQEKNQVGSI